MGHTFINLVMEEFHKTPLGGHMGVAKTLCRLRYNFFWPHICQDITRYVAQCSTCQQMKYKAKKPVGLLHPFPIPSAIWEDLTLDFTTGLPISNGYTMIMVVVDKYSKGTHLGPLPSHFTVHKVAVLFLDTICKLHGFPRNLVSDQDPIFISSFWRDLFRLSGTKLCMSTAYHP